MQTLLALDQGTTSSRTLVFDENLDLRATFQQEFAQHYPQSGWVEHDPEDIWQTCLSTLRDAIASCDVPPIAMGITNQRETLVAWDRETGESLTRAIVWQDRRTAAICRELKSLGHEAEIAEKTGLLLDPYFTATKMRWMLDHVPRVAEAAKHNRLCLGTVDSFLIWRLTGGQKFVTDATNASRTLLCNISTGAWDEDLCRLFGISQNWLPEIRDCADDFGTTDPSLFGVTFPILGVAGDQQAAAIGQACFSAGMLKSTYGTGCFALLNTGETLVTSRNRLLGTIAYRLNGKITYALEGSIFVAGASVQWLRDGLGTLNHANDSERLAQAADPEQDVILVPAFTGLGAPYWDADCRGALFGLTRNTGPNELARAALQAVGYQTRDLLDAMRSDMKMSEALTIRVDGGMSANQYAMQFLADITGCRVERPEMLETTAQGAAWLAGYQAGIFTNPQARQSTWEANACFTPSMTTADAERKYLRWKDCVRRTLVN